MIKSITIEPVLYKTENRIKLIFPYDDGLIGMVRDTPACGTPLKGGQASHMQRLEPHHEMLAYIP